MIFENGANESNETRLSTKGQVILPKTVRDSKAWGPGTKFVVEEMGDGVFLRPVPQFPVSTLDEVVGCLQSSGQKARTLEEMQEAMKRQVRRRQDSGRY